MENDSLVQLRNTYNCPELDELSNKYDIPVGEICSKLGIKAGRYSMQDDERGRIFLEDSKYFIHVNKNDHPEIQRFTVAHELGHYCLHKDFLDRKGQILERNNLSSRGTDQKEVEANRFAAELLMPKKHFLEKCSELKTITLLADYFFVSRIAIQVRLSNLGMRV